MRWKRIGTVLAWVVGLSAFYAVLLGTQTLDAIDKEFPNRGGICTEPSELVIRYELRAAEIDDDIADALRCVPASHQELANRFGAKLVIDDEPLEKAFPQIEVDPVSELAGVYDPKTRTLYVNQRKRYPGKTTLHELGHLVDHALGDPSEREPYTSIHAAARARGDLALRLAASPREHFAESFARYYFSDRTRRRLQEQDARTWEYFRDLKAR